MTTSEQAATLGVNVLAWLAAEDELLSVFMGASGVSVDDLRAGLAEPEVQAAALDFLLMDDAWVVRFCDAHGLPYDAPMRARQALPGGAEVNWT